MAAGLSLEEDKFELFQQRFANWLLSGWTLRYCKAKWCRTSVKPGRNDHGSSAAAARCWPWGQMFPEPLFDGHFRLLQQGWWASVI